MLQWRNSVVRPYATVREMRHKLRPRDDGELTQTRQDTKGRVVRALDISCLKMLWTW